MIHAPMTEADLQTLERRILIVDTPIPRDDTDDLLAARVDAQQAWFRESFEIVEHLIATVRAVVELKHQAEQEVQELKEWRDVVAPMLTGKPHQPAPRTFQQDLRQLLNQYSQEIPGGHTPDFILSRYLRACLELFGSTVQRRDLWYDHRRGQPDLEETAHV